MFSMRVNNEVLEFSKIIYVDSLIGSDDNDGSSVAMAVASLQKALSLIDSDETCVYAVGTFTVESLDYLIVATQYNYTLLGDGLNTRIMIQSALTNKFTSVTKTTRLMRFIVQPVSNFKGDTRAYMYWSGGSTLNLKCYNLLFQRNNGYPTSDTIYHTNSGPGGYGAEYHNCSFEVASSCYRISNSVTPEFYDTAIDCSQISQQFGIKDSSYVDAVIFSEKGKITTDKSKWKNKSKFSLNPDGTPGHYGVYGGPYAWEDIVYIIEINDEKLEFDQVYYVSPEGDDSNDGLSRETPVKNYETLKDKCSSKSLTCIYFLPGIHKLTNKYLSSYTSVGLYDYGKPIHFLGENGETRLNYARSQSTSRDGSAINFDNTNSVLSNLIYEYEPGGGNNYSNSLINHSYGTFYNVLFRNVSKVNGFSYVYSNSISGYPILINCTFDTSLIRSDYSGSPQYINCHFTRPPGRGSSISHVIGDLIIEDTDFDTLSDSLRHKGKSDIYNPDGSQSNVGVGGGPFAWCRAPIYIKLPGEIHTHYVKSPEFSNSKNLKFEIVRLYCEGNDSVSSPEKVPNTNKSNLVCIDIKYTDVEGDVRYKTLYHHFDLPREGFYSKYDEEGHEYHQYLEEGIAIDSPDTDYDFFTTPDNIVLKPVEYGKLVCGQDSQAQLVELINSSKKDVLIEFQVLDYRGLAQVKDEAYYLGDDINESTKVVIMDESCSTRITSLRVNASERLLLNIIINPFDINDGSEEITIRMKSIDV